MSSGSGCSSTSWLLRYRDEPCDFFVFFLEARFAYGSIRSTIVWRPSTDDMFGAGGAGRGRVGAICRRSTGAHGRYVRAGRRRPRNAALPSGPRGRRTGRRVRSRGQRPPIGSGALRRAEARVAVGRRPQRVRVAGGRRRAPPICTRRRGRARVRRSLRYRTARKTAARGVAARCRRPRPRTRTPRRLRFRIFDLARGDAPRLAAPPLPERERGRRGALRCRRG